MRVIFAGSKAAGRTFDLKLTGKFQEEYKKPDSPRAEDGDAPESE